MGYTPKLSTSVWVGYPDAGVAIAGAQGGTLAAPVWNAFMSVAHGEDCSPFPQPKTAATLTAGQSSSGSTGTGTYSTPGTTAPYTPAPTTGTDPSQGGGQPDQGYDPRLYEAPPQPAPAPAPAPAPQGGSGQGGGGQGGQGGGATPGGDG